MNEECEPGPAHVITECSLGVVQKAMWSVQYEPCIGKLYYHRIKHSMVHKHCKVAVHVIKLMVLVLYRVHHINQQCLTPTHDGVFCVTMHLPMKIPM